MSAFRTGIVLLVDGGKPLYRDPWPLEMPIPGQGTPLEILSGRLKQIPGVEGPLLLGPEGPEAETLCHQARALGLELESFNRDLIVEQRRDWHPEHWGISDDSGIDFLVGSPLTLIFEKKRWETVIVVPLRHLLVDAAEISASLRIHCREGYDATFSADRLPGAGWLIFQNELLQGMQKSHPDLMNARGGLIWALRKPLYPFKIGHHHAPRDRCDFSVDLRLDRKRVFDLFRESAGPDFSGPEFSYARWIRGMEWRERYADAGPESIRIEPTTLCRGQCVCCPQPGLKRARGVMSEQVFERILCDFQECQDAEWVISGMGEPFEHPRLAAMVSALKGKRVRLETSLQPSPPEDFPWDSLSHVRVSVDALEESRFMKMRPGCEWKTIERFIAESAERKRKDPDRWPAVGVSFLKHRENEAVALPFVKYWRKVTTAPFHGSFFRWPADEAPAEVQWYQILGVSDFLSQIPWEGAIRYTPLNRRACRHGVLTACINQDGSMPICRFDFEGIHLLGRVAEAGDGPMALWKSDAARAFRRGLLRREYSDSLPCGTCVDWYHP